MQKNKTSCGNIAAWRNKVTNQISFSAWRCGATLKCEKCARRRARALLTALAAVQPPGLKLIHLTITFKPTLGVTHANLPRVRHAIFEFLRRRLNEKGRGLEYVCAVEKHRSGKPHLHIAIWYPTVRALQRDARAAVKGSHCHARLVRDDVQLLYLSKYVGKQRGSKLTSSRNVARLARRRVEGSWALIAVAPDSVPEINFRADIEDLDRLGLL